VFCHFPENIGFLIKVMLPLRIHRYVAAPYGSFFVDEFFLFLLFHLITFTSIIIRLFLLGEHGRTGTIKEAGGGQQVGQNI
jgi:hypothetical protein